MNCIKCGKEFKGAKGTGICLECAGELADNMTTEQLIAHAKVGFVALIDEVTGYEKIRPKDELKKKLKEYKLGVKEC